MGGVSCALHFLVAMGEAAWGLQGAHLSAESPWLTDAQSNSLVKIHVPF